MLPCAGSAGRGRGDAQHWEVVYNQRIADYHSYFVTDGDWGFSVWSQNAYRAVHYTNISGFQAINRSGEINTGCYVQYAEVAGSGNRINVVSFETTPTGIAALERFLGGPASRTGARGTDRGFIVDITHVTLGPPDLNGGVRLDSPATQLIARINDVGDPQETAAAVATVKKHYGI